MTWWLLNASYAAVLIALVAGAVACVALGNETIAIALASGAIGALAAPERRATDGPARRPRTGKTPVRGIPVNAPSAPSPPKET